MDNCNWDICYLCYLRNSSYHFISPAHSSPPVARSFSCRLWVGWLLLRNILLQTVLMPDPLLLEDIPNAKTNVSFLTMQRSRTALPSSFDRELMVNLCLKEILIISEQSFSNRTLTITRGNHKIPIEILTLSEESPKTKRILVIQHGILDVSNSWRPLALKFLTSNIFDEVWLPNTRGNHYSQTADAAWSLETLAADTNAILMEAREAGMSTSFIRHSQGTAQILALLSMNPDVPVEKVVLLAPVTTMDLQRIKLSNGEFTELANAMFAVLETGRTDFLDLSLGDSLSREMTKCMLVWV